MKFGITTVLSLIFMILKLTGYIDWSWFLVFLPSIIIWGIFFIGVLVTLTFALFPSFKKTKRKY